MVFEVAGVFLVVPEESHKVQKSQIVPTDVDQIVTVRLEQDKGEEVVEFAPSGLQRDVRYVLMDQIARGEHQDIITKESDADDF